MPYCFTKLRPEPDGNGFRPDFPESVSFLLLADTYGPSTWGLYQASGDEPGAWKPEHPASKSLAALIESGKRYPPALALARKSAQVLKGHDASIEGLARTYATAIQHHLSRQPEAPYLLAVALQGDGIDLCRGEWYWLLKADSSTVYWVSDDFHVYPSPIAAFDLTGAQLKRLS